MSDHNFDDLNCYRAEIDHLLPEMFFDFHVHLWEKKSIPQSPAAVNPSLPRVMDEYPMEELERFYRAALPGKPVRYLVFGFPEASADLVLANRYIIDVVNGQNCFGLAMISPRTPLEQVRKWIENGGLLGYKPYWTFVDWKEQNEVTIRDMMTEEQLDYADRLGLIVVLHIPRKLRLADPRNIEDLRALGLNFPRIKLILAHCGRSYCLSSIEHQLEKLMDLPGLYWDLSVVQNWEVLEYLFQRVESRKIVFGSDLPITTVRGATVCINDQSLFVTEKSYPWSLSNPDLPYRFAPMFFQILRALNRAAHRCGLTDDDLERMLNRNAWDLIQAVQSGNEGSRG